MAQQVIAARDFEVAIFVKGIPVPFKISTGATFSSNVTGQTDDIGAFSTDDPIATDNGGNTYDIQLSLQQAEAIRILDAIDVAYKAMSAEDKAANFPNLGHLTGDDVAPAHIRDFVENVTIVAQWFKRRDVPATVTTETYERCTGVEGGDNVERRATETLKTWRFRALGMTRETAPLL